jgi:hypothetical protein
VPIGPVGAAELVQVELVDHVDQEPHQMFGRQPVPHVRSQQEPLLAITGDELQPHPVILPHMIANPLRDIPLRNRLVSRNTSGACSTWVC